MVEVGGRRTSALSRGNSPPTAFFQVRPRESEVLVHESEPSSDPRASQTEREVTGFE